MRRSGLLATKKVEDGVCQAPLEVPDQLAKATAGPQGNTCEWAKHIISCNLPLPRGAIGKHSNAFAIVCSSLDSRFGRGGH